MSKTPSRSLNFLDFGVYVVLTPIFPTNQRKCVISSRIVAILILLSTTVQHRAQQIDRQSALQTSQKEKNERTPFTLTYHTHNLAAKNIILITLSYSKMTTKQEESIHNPHWFHSNATKT